MLPESTAVAQKANKGALNPRVLVISHTGWVGEHRP